MAMQSAPNSMNNWHKTFEEVFKSLPVPSESDALRILNEVRDCHKLSDGWVEFHYEIIKLPNGQYQAIRHHAKYSRHAKATNFA